MRIVLLGPPASGKGTQGRRLAASLGVPYLSTGALLRENIEERTALGLAAQPILARGGYLPDDLMSPILGEWLEIHQDQPGWVLDGFPRSVPQARFLERWLADHGLAPNEAVALEVPHEGLLIRIRNRVECPSCRWTGQRDELKGGIRCASCGENAAARSDDDEENFRNRHAEFTQITVPAIEYYCDRGRLLAVSASAPQDEVAATILAKLLEDSRPDISPTS